MESNNIFLDELRSKGIEIKKIRYRIKQNEITVHISCDSNLDVENIDSIIKPMFAYLKLDNIIVELDKVQHISIEPENQYAFIRNVLEKNFPSCKSWIKFDSFILEENRIICYPPNKTVLYLLEQKKEEILSDLGNNYLLEFMFQEDKFSSVNENFQEKLIVEEDSFTDELRASIYEKSMEESLVNEKRKEKLENEAEYIFGRDKFSEPTLISSAVCPSNVTFELDIFDLEIKGLKSGKSLLILSCCDKSDSRTVKAFLKEEEIEPFLSNIKNGSHILASGKYDIDKFDNTPVLIARNIKAIEKEVRWDTSQEKRIEFHLHSKMSNTDGTHSISDYIEVAKKWGHKAIAITDHNVVQAFPEAMSAAKKNDIQVIYGLEADIIDDEKNIYLSQERLEDDGSFIVFDIETTGFSPINDEITEIGAVKIIDGRIVGHFSEFVNPGRPIPEKIIELTGITDDMVANADGVQVVLSKFDEFVGKGTLVAHNAGFDSRFIEYRRGSKNPYPIIDTLLLSQALIPEAKNYKLGTLAKKFGISLVNAHRAVNDAQATAELFLILIEKAKKKGIRGLDDLNSLKRTNPEKSYPKHMTIYAKNKKGLFNLYKLISQSHMETYFRTARILKSNLKKNKDGLIFGSACMEGELIDSYLRGAKKEELLDIIKQFDFLEVQPPIRYKKLLRDNLLNSEKQIHQLIKDIISLGKELNKPVVATGDVHYLNPEDEILHDILTFSKNSYGSATGEESAYFYTTNEMMEAFSFLGEDLSKEIVIKNPNELLLSFEKIDPIPSGKYPPEIKNSDSELKTNTMKKAIEIYGDPLPKIVKERLDKELDSIIGNGYAVMYKIAQDLVKKSNEDGYYVGSRGSVGSSLVATMTDITEVNPLSPHYVCPKCRYSEFITDGSFSSGVDLPKKACPHCGHPLNRDGHQIPFEVFLGFYGDKEPDIDLNFAGEYQSRAHKFIEDWFGSGYVFRAGTIGTLAEKTAFGYVKKYCEVKELYKSPLEIKRLSLGIVGVKRTSGQHPGGIMIVPTNNDIHEFTPIQFPADDKKKNVITTHFDYHSISENILKLDILGHDAPSILKMLEDFTGVNIDQVDLNDEKVMSLFLSQDALNADENIFKSTSGTYGIPEFGTSFVMKMLQETHPKTFSELVNISGLSHGTEVWTDNAQNLVNQGKASISEVICTREDIMNYLIQAGADNKMAFDVMESVRKGRGLPEKYLDQLCDLSLPDWYLDSCRKIKYMFPKAHAVAYVTTSVRIAWYKIYYPLAFYASYFTTKLSDFNSQVALSSIESIKSTITSSQDFQATKKEKDEAIVLQLVLEMYARGFEFKKVSITESHYSKFLISDNRILLPLQSLNGVGESVAKSIFEEAKKKDFLSIEDMMKRTGASKTVVESLKDHGVLNGLAKTNQLSLMDMLAN